MEDNLEEYVDSQLYDAEYGGYKGDLDLFLSLVETGSVLDLACGTGRLTIPLAKKGLKVFGLDASEPMLELAREKSKDFSIKWIQGDVRDFHLNETFDLILMAGNAFQALLSEPDQISMLDCVRRHLKPSGLFVFNTRNPQENDFKTTSEFEFWHDFQDQYGDEVKVFGKQEVDPSHPVIKYTTKRVWKDKETTNTIDLRFTPYDQLLRLLEQTGFKICEVFGDDKKNLFRKDSPSIIFVCRLK